MIDFPDDLSATDRDVLTGAPVVLFLLLVASSTADASVRQGRAFSSVLRGADAVPSSWFAAALGHAADDYEEIRSRFAGRSLDPVAEFATTMSVLQAHSESSPDEVAEFSQGLVVLAGAIARAGGRKRILGLGTKLTRANRNLLMTVRNVFGN